MLTRTAKKLVVAVLGGTVILLGIIMLVAPGPGILTIIGGLALLATEFVWAAHLMKRIKQRTAQAVDFVRNHATAPKRSDSEPTE